MFVNSWYFAVKIHYQTCKGRLSVDICLKIRIMFVLLGHLNKVVDQLPYLNVLDIIRDYH